MRKVTHNPQFWYNPNAYDAYRHALLVIKDRWTDGEPYIMKHPQWAYTYAFDIMGKRWLEAEHIIMKSRHFSFWYARDVIQDRWKEAEKYIRNSYCKEDYEEYFNCKLDRN